MSSDSRDKKTRSKGAKGPDSTQELPLGWPTEQAPRTRIGPDLRLNIEVVAASSALATAVEEAALLNLAADLIRDGKRLELDNVNQLVAALFEVMGVSALAKVTTR